MDFDKVTKIELKRKPGFCDNLRNSVAGVIGGVLLFFASLYILYYRFRFLLLLPCFLVLRKSRLSFSNKVTNTFGACIQLY